jgi:hypothetical protein
MGATPVRGVRKSKRRDEFGIRRGNVRIIATFGVIVKKEVRLRKGKSVLGRHSDGLDESGMGGLVRKMPLGNGESGGVG